MASKEEIGIKSYSDTYGKVGAADFFKKPIEEIERICSSIESTSKDERPDRLSMESKRSHDRSRYDDRSSTKRRKYGDRDDRVDKRTASRHRSRERKYEPKKERSRSRSRGRSERYRSKERDRRESTDKHRRRADTHLEDRGDVSSASAHLDALSAEERNHSDDCVEVEDAQSDSTQLNGQQVNDQLSYDEQSNGHSIVHHSNGFKWVSTYLDSTADNQKSDNFIFNSFKSLLNIKKRFIETENLISIIECNLVSNATDIYLYTSQRNDERSLSKDGLNIRMLLACTSTGLKFKPAFMLDNLKLSSPLIKNENIEHVTSLNEWLEPVFKCEMKKNLINDGLCLTGSEHFIADAELSEKFYQLNCVLIVIPNSLKLRLSPFQHSLLSTLNGLLHKNHIESKQFPLTLDESIQSFLTAWSKLSKNDILNAFQGIVNTCLGD